MTKVIEGSWTTDLKSLYVLSQHIVDTRSHKIVDTMSQQFVDNSRPISGTVEHMTNALPPRVRAMIINFDPTQPDALSISEFCKTQKIYRSIFYRLRHRATNESAAVLHPQSRAPKRPARKYGPEVIHEVVKVRQRLKKDGWDFGSKTIHYEATVNENQFPGEAFGRPLVHQHAFPGIFTGTHQAG